MSFTFNKHNPKSYVVRGDVIENLKSRQEFISKLTGKCVFNTRLKFGPGLLVPINDKNTEILNSLSENTSNKNEKRLESVIVPYDDGINDKKENNDLDDLLLKLINDDNLEENPNKEDSNNLRGGIQIAQNEVVGPPTVETKSKIDNSNLDHTFKIDEKQINKISVKKNKKTEKNKNEINKHKEKQVSIIDVHQEMSSSDRTEKSRTKKSSERESRDSRDQKRDPVREKDTRDKSLARNEDSRSRDEHSSRDRREKEREREREREKEKKSRRNRRRHDSSSESDSSDDDSNSSSSSEESSDYSGDSSEDERIQETIRRKGQRPNRRKLELDNSDVDSDHEDIVTLSRRVRYILKKLHSIENFLRK